MGSRSQSAVIGAFAPGEVRATQVEGRRGTMEGGLGGGWNEGSRGGGTMRALASGCVAEGRTGISWRFRYRQEPRDARRG
jgi:hypothetical protein